MKILIVDDHVLLREGFAWSLARLGPDAEIFEAGDIPEALACARSNDIDLVILDLYLPGCRGLDALNIFRKEFPRVRIVLLSATDDDELVRKAMATGASGFIHKSASSGAVLDAVRDVLQGNTCLIAPPPLPENDDRIKISRLTPREREVADAFACGQSYKEVARQLGIAPNTVRNILVSIYGKLGVSDKGKLAQLLAEYAQR